MGKYGKTQVEGQNNWPLLFKMSGLWKTKEDGQIITDVRRITLNAMWGPGLDPGTEKWH